MSTDDSPKADEQNPSTSGSRNTAESPEKRSSINKNRCYWVLFLVSLIGFIILLLLIALDWGEQTTKLVTSIMSTISLGGLLAFLVKYFIKNPHAILASFLFRSAVVALAVLDIGLGGWLIYSKMQKRNETISVELKPENDTLTAIEPNNENSPDFTLPGTPSPPMRREFKFIVTAPSGIQINDRDGLLKFYDRDEHQRIKHKYQDSYHILSFQDGSRSYNIAAHYQKAGYFFMAETSISGSAQIDTLELEEVIFSTLRIRCNCDGEIYVDGESRGRTSKVTSNDFDIFPGERSIELRCNDGTSFSKKETLMPGKTKEISF